MNKMVTGEANTVFAALKLIEQLYIDGKISEMVYRSIILENAAGEDIQKFTGFYEGRKTRKGGTL